MIQDQSESNFHLSEEAGLTPLLAMTQSFEDSDWLLSKKEIKE